MKVFIISLILTTCISTGLADYELTILHTNDVHSRIDEAHKYGGVCSPKQSAGGDCVGGAAREYTKIQEINATADNLLLLDGGDQFQGTFWFFVYRGRAAAQVMQELGYDAMAIGNHEFDLGLDPLQDFINNVSSSFDVLSSSIDNTNEPRLSGYKPYVIKQVGNRKIGIVGYTTADTPALTSAENTGKLVFKNVVQSIKDSITVMKAEDSSVDIIIAVGHAGFSIDKEIAKQVDDVDVVVGGHTNTFLFTGPKPSSEKPSGTYPYKVNKDNGKVALCVQAYTFSKYLGNLRVTFDDNGDVKEWGGNPILLDHTVVKDARIEAMLAPLKAHVAEKGNVTIARSAVTLNADCRVAECNFGNLVTDAWIHSNIMFGTDIRWARAAIALINGGSIRAPMERGTITNRDLKTSMPFSNDIVTVTISGLTLKKVFEHSARAFTAADNGRFLQMSGAQVKYDLNGPDGEKAVEIKLRCLKCEVPKYEPLDLNSNYTILITSFLAAGGDGYGMLVSERLGFENLGYDDSTMVAEYMSILHKIYPTEEGRIQFLSEKSTPASSAISTRTTLLSIVTVVLSIIAVL